MRIVSLAVFFAVLIPSAYADDEQFFRSYIDVPLLFTGSSSTQEIMPTISPISDLEAIVDTPFDFTPTLTAGNGQITWNVEPAFPVASGLGLSPGNGRITGTPSTAGYYGTFQISASNSAGVGEETFELMVYSRLTAASTNIVVDAGAIDVDLGLTGGKAPYSVEWASDGSDPPEWLQLLENGKLAGLAEEGTYSGLKVTVGDALAQVVVRAFDLIVEPAMSVVGWGYNNGGSLGTGDAVTIKRSPVPLLGMSGFETISSRLSHACGMRNENVYCWGNNFYGQLGLGDTTERLTPTLVGSGYSMIAASAGFTCGLKDGDVYCWGDNAKKQLGLNGISQTPLPTQVPSGGTIFIGVTASNYNVCAWTASLQYWCWGENAYGQLPSATASFATPTHLATLDGYDRLVIGEYHGCGIKSGTVYCWSKTNSWGQLGSGSKGTGSLTPKSLGSGWTWVDVGSTFSCGRQSGVVKCWGDNAYGEFGNGNQGTNSPTPFTLSMHNQYDYLGLGAYFMCGLKDGAAYCWGANHEGYVGNGGTTGTFSTPQLVAGGHMFDRLFVTRNNTYGILRP